MIIWLSLRTMLFLIKPCPMKKIMMFLLLPIFANAQKADSTKLLQKVSFGVIVATVATTTFSQKAQQPFSTGYNLLGDVTFVTPKTFHNLMYGTGDHSLRSLNGYFLPKDLDVYTLYAYGLKTKSKYLGFGIERMMLHAQSANIFLGTEVGTNFKGNTSLSFVVLLNLQNPLWKRK